MIESEDGTVTGSIDVSRLDSIEAKTDEAKAQLDALKRDRDAGQQQAQADSERLNQQQADANPLQDEPVKDNRDAQGKSVAPADQADQKAPAKKSASSSSTDRG